LKLRRGKGAIPTEKSLDVLQKIWYGKKWKHFFAPDPSHFRLEVPDRGGYVSINKARFHAIEV
jgi:hypothetical protein